MRRIIVLMLLLVLTGTGYGAVSEDMSVYVRKDVFEVHLQNINQNINAKFDKLNEKFEALNAKFDMVMGELKEQRQMIMDISNRLSALTGRVDGIDARVSDLRNDIYLGLVILGILVSWPKLKETARKWVNSTPSITLEDVKRLIEENNARMSGKVQS